MKIKEKLSKRQLTKTYMNIITMAKQLNKSSWSAPLETNNGIIYITISLSDTDETQGETKTSNE